MIDKRVLKLTLSIITRFIVYSIIFVLGYIMWAFLTFAIEGTVWQFDLVSNLKRLLANGCWLLPLLFSILISKRKIYPKQKEHKHLKTKLGTEKRNISNKNKDVTESLITKKINLSKATGKEK